MKTSLSGWIVVIASAGAVFCSGCGEKSASTDASSEPVVQDLQDVLTSDAPVPASLSMPVKPAFTGEVSVVIDKTIEIKRAEVDEVVNSMFKANAARIPPDQVAAARADMRESAIFQLTRRALLLRECDKADVEVTDAEVDKFFAEATGGQGTMEQMAEESGMTMERLRSMLASSLRIEKMLEAKAADLPEPTDEELKAKFDEIIAEHPEAAKKPESVEASHILVKVDEKTTDEEARAKIDAIREQLLAGTNFAELAKSKSDCNSGADGGSLGRFGRGRMVKEFEDAAFTQDVGVIGEVVKTQFGYHVIRVDAKEEAGEVVFDDVKEQLRKGAKMEARAKVKSEFIKSVEGAAQIENLEAAVVSEAVQAQPAEDAEPAPRRVPEWAR
ncbi:MAG: peptidylprolyl isomerase [Kiritimatiellia bacterium]